MENVFTPSGVGLSTLSIVDPLQEAILEYRAVCRDYASEWIRCFAIRQKMGSCVIKSASLTFNTVAFETI